MDYLIITCKPDNIPSYRTCELLGGDLLEVKDLPKDHDLCRQGYTNVNVYRFDLNNLQERIMIREITILDVPALADIAIAF